MITITEKARTYLESIKLDTYITLSVKGGGCSGFQ